MHRGGQFSNKNYRGKTVVPAGFRTVKYRDSRIPHKKYREEALYTGAGFRGKNTRSQIPKRRTFQKNILWISWRRQKAPSPIINGIDEAASVSAPPCWSNLNKGSQGLQVLSLDKRQKMGEACRFCHTSPRYTKNQLYSLCGT